jgi:S-adenosylmethionine/arginine decarboxylase-like enzyme
VIEHNRFSEFFTLGEHYICDLSDCDPALLLDSERARNLFTQAVRKSGSLKSWR